MEFVMRSYCATCRVIFNSGDKVYIDKNYILTSNAPYCEKHKRESFTPSVCVRMTENNHAIFSTQMLDKLEIRVVPLMKV